MKKAIFKSSLEELTIVLEPPPYAAFWDNFILSPDYVCMVKRV